MKPVPLPPTATPTTGAKCECGWFCPAGYQVASLPSLDVVPAHTVAVQFWCPVCGSLLAFVGHPPQRPAGQA